MLVTAHGIGLLICELCWATDREPARSPRGCRAPARTSTAPRSAALRPLPDPDRRRLRRRPLLLAHDRALVVYGSAKAASRSQVVMLVPMVCFTCLGLRLLSAALDG